MEICYTFIEQIIKSLFHLFIFLINLIYLQAEVNHFRFLTITNKSKRLAMFVFENPFIIQFNHLLTLFRFFYGRSHPQPSVFI